jgi:hypothetical protein
MIRSAIKGTVYFTALCVLGYLFFFVPLGERTLWEHTRRIAATDEAQELGDDVSVAGERVETAVREKLRDAVIDAGP